jgi:hypothetical protein
MSLPGDPQGEHREPEPSAGRRRDARLVLTGVLLALVIWFALANTQDVRIRFWIVSTKTPVVSALAIATALGVSVGLLVARRFRRPSS